MGSGGGSSSSTYSPPPEVAAAYKMLLEKAGPLVDQKQVRYTPDQAAYYAGLVPATLAPFTPYQVEGMQDVAGLRGFSTPYVQSATDLYTQAANPLNKQQFSGAAVDQYMSPYLQNVVQGAVQNINETNAQQQQQVLGNAIAKGAFGGDRAGIVRGQLARQQDLANNATLANLLNQGYTQALGEFNQQQGVDLATQLQNRQLQSAAGTNLLGAAQAGQGLALQQALAEMGVGQQQQQQRQQELMTAYQNFLNEQGYPYQQLGWLGNMVSGAATGMGGTTTSHPAQPSGLSQAIGGLGSLATIAGLFFNKGGRATYDDGGGVAPMSKVKPQDFLGGLQIKGATPHVPQAPTSQKSDDLASVIKSATPGLKELNRLFTKDGSKLEGTPAPDAPTPPPRPAEFSDTAMFAESHGGRIHYATGGDALPSSLANLSTATAKLPGGAPAQSSGGGGGGLGGLGNQVDQNAVTTENIYRALLHRSAEPAAIAGRSSELAAGTSTPQSIFDQTKASPEYQALMKDKVASSKLPAPPQAPAAYQNYQNLVNSGHASLADLQAGYNNYLKSAQTPMMPYMALPTVTSAKAEADAAAKAKEDATAPKIVAEETERGGWRGGRFNYASGGGTDITLQYGAQTLADLQNIAEAQAGSGLGGLNPNAEALALKDYGLATGGRAHFLKGGPSNADTSSDADAPDVVEAPMDAYKRAIAGNETSGFKNPYAALGPINAKTGDRPYGKYQIMGNNIPSWTEAALGQKMSPAEFLNNQDAQEKVFEHRFGNYLKQTNSPQDAASMWHSGVPLAQAQKEGRADVNMSTADYVRKFANSLASTPKGQDLLQQINEGAVRSGQADRERTTPLDPHTRLPIKEASSKEGLWGAMGVSTTPSERLALFNAFATLAGTPGKFGVGLAAAAKSYSDTLAKHQELYQKGVNYQSEAEQRYASAKNLGSEAEMRKIKPSIAGYQYINPTESGLDITNIPLPTKPGETTAFRPQQQGAQQTQPILQQQAQAAGAPAPSAPQGPETKAKDIDLSMFGPRPVEDTGYLTTPQKYIEQDTKLAMASPEAGVNAQKEFAKQAEAAQTAYNTAAIGKQDLITLTQAATTLRPDSFTGSGAGAEFRTGIANAFNTAFGMAGTKDALTDKDVSAGQIMDKIRTFAANNQGNEHGRAAGFWLQNMAGSYPGVGQTESAMKELVASLWAANQRAIDYGNFVNWYGNQTYRAGTSVSQAFNNTYDVSLYKREKDAIKGMLMDTKVINGERQNLITLLQRGVITPPEFNQKVMDSKVGVNNLSRYFTGL